MSLIRTIIAQAVLNSTDLTMKHGDAAWQNMFADDTTGTAVFLHDPLKLRFDNLVFLQESYPVVISFLQKSELGYSPEDHDGNTDYPRTLMRSFVAWCRDNKDLIADFKVTEAVELWNLFDANLDGWMLYCTIKPANAGPAC